MLARLGVVGLGLLVGFHAAVVHRHDAVLGGLTVPWGLALALLTTGAVAWACDLLVRAGGAWFGLGWTLAIAGQQSVRSGTYLVAGDAIGWTFMGAGLVVLAVVVLVRTRTSSRRGRPPSI